MAPAGARWISGATTRTSGARRGLRSPRIRRNFSSSTRSSSERGSVIFIVCALAATVAALPRCASDPSPIRFSKLRFWEESHFSPLPALREATARHIEQPGGSMRNPARS